MMNILQQSTLPNIAMIFAKTFSYVLERLPLGYVHARLEDLKKLLQQFHYQGRLGGLIAAKQL